MVLQKPPENRRNKWRNNCPILNWWYHIGNYYVTKVSTNWLFRSQKRVSFSIPRNSLEFSVKCCYDYCGWTELTKLNYWELTLASWLLSGSLCALHLLRARVRLSVNKSLTKKELFFACGVAICLVLRILRSHSITKQKRWGGKFIMSVFVLAKGIKTVHGRGVSNGRILST